MRLSIAGNIIDFSTGLSVSPELVRRTVAQSLGQALDRRTLERLRQAAAAAQRILYIGDNAGEAVFDRILLDRLPAGRVLFAVRGGPVMNDCTQQDAAEAGITGLAPIIDTGSDIAGVILERCSSGFRRAYAGADLIIAKGQGNYETLSDEAGPVFFLFKVKCPTVAASCGMEIGSLAMLDGRRGCDRWAFK